MTLVHIKRLQKFVHFRLNRTFQGYLTNPAFHSEWPGPLLKLQEASLKAARNSLANKTVTRYGPNLTVLNEMLSETGIPEN